MKFAINTAHGYLSLQPNGAIEFRDSIGPYETFDNVNLEVPVEPVEPVPIPPEPNYPIKPDNMTDREWFDSLVEGKPFGQQTLLDLEPTLNWNDWQLTPPNAVGDRTKILPADADNWVRVGFGEGEWVWVIQNG